MPMPTPGSTEEKDIFLKRFMDNEDMKKEYPDEKQRYAVALKQWEKDSAAAKLYRINNVPIFEAGTWKDGQLVYPIEKLRQMVASANELKDRIKPYIFLGHGDDEQMQKFTGQPAVGVLENVRLEGQRIIADFADLPIKIYELLKAKAYRRWSVEIAKKFKDSVTGKVHERLLSGLALLGAEHPAVNTLPDTIDGYAKLYYSDSLEFDYLTSEIKSETVDIDIITEGGDKMNDEKVDKMKVELEKTAAKLAAAEKANVEMLGEKADELKAANNKLLELEAEIEKRDTSTRKLKIDECIERWTADGKLIPAQAEIYRERLENVDDLDAESTKLDAMFKEMPKLVDLDNNVGDDADKLSEDAKKTHLNVQRDRLKAEIAACGVRVDTEDNEGIEEFAEVMNTGKRGERIDKMVKSRDRLMSDITKYI